MSDSPLRAALARAEKAERERDAAVVALKLAADRLEARENDCCQHYGSCYCHSESDEARRLLGSLSSAGSGIDPGHNPATAPKAEDTPGSEPAEKP